MTYKVPVDKEHLQWLMEQIEARCADKERANFARVHGRFDREFVISVAPQDRNAINDEFLVDMKRALRERTGLLALVIYLDGYEPPIVREHDPSSEAKIMKLRVIDALQLPEVLDGSKWLRLSIPVLGTDRETTDHGLPTMTVGADPGRRKMYYCDHVYEPRAARPTYFGTEAAFTLGRLLGECRLVDAEKGPDA